jgi:hypothetical protein
MIWIPGVVLPYGTAMFWDLSHVYVPGSRVTVKCKRQIVLFEF